MNLLRTCQDTINFNVESGSHTKQSGRRITRKKRLLIKENFDTDSAANDASIVPQGTKSKAFNNSTISNKKDWHRGMGYRNDKMFS